MINITSYSYISCMSSYGSHPSFIFLVCLNSLFKMFSLTAAGQVRVDGLYRKAPLHTVLPAGIAGDLSAGKV